jgi:hypothetical protein
MLTNTPKTLAEVFAPSTKESDALTLDGDPTRQLTDLDRIELGIQRAKRSFEAIYHQDLKSKSLSGPAASLWNDLKNAERECWKAKNPSS